MEIALSTRQAYSEVDEFLKFVSIEKREKIPASIRELFETEKDKEYVKTFNPMAPIKEQNFKEETLGIIALLNLRYWCQDEKEKERLKKVYAENENAYQEILSQKYNPDNIFSNNTSKIEEQKAEITELQEIEEESLIKKIINKIFSIFKKK